MSCKIWSSLIQIMSRMETSDVDELFNIFNVSASGTISKEEFVFCWTEWIKRVARPSSALVVVDVQNDFISGSLAIINCPAGQNGEDVSFLLFALTALIALFDTINILLGFQRKLESLKIHW